MRASEHPPRAASIPASLLTLAFVLLWASVGEGAEIRSPEEEKTPAVAVAPGHDRRALGSTDYAPITDAERRQRLTRVFLSPGVPLRALALAGLAQCAEEPEEWGTGAGGFGRRTLSALGVGFLRGAMRESMAASLDLDPRYHRCRCSGFFRRSGHAFTMTVVAYDSAGRRRFDPTQLGSSYASAMIETSWYPARYGPFDRGLEHGHALTLSVLGRNLVREFTPELRRLLPGKRKAKRQD